MLRPTLVILACLSFVACKKESKPAAPAATDKPADPATTDKPAEPAAASGGTVDQSDPVKVLEHVFAAAAAGKPDGLAGLCDPGGSGDGDVKRICGSKADDPKWNEFVSYFAKGKVKGDPRVEGDKAEIDFLFGPDGTKDETMKLAKIDGKWYLASF